MRERNGSAELIEMARCNRRHSDHIDTVGIKDLLEVPGKARFQLRD
jgi:hypothetical protein